MPCSRRTNARALHCAQRQPAGDKRRRCAARNKVGPFRTAGARGVRRTRRSRAATCKSSPTPIIRSQGECAGVIFVDSPENTIVAKQNERARISITLIKKKNLLVFNLHKGATNLPGLYYCVKFTVSVTIPRRSARMYQAYDSFFKANAPRFFAFLFV